MSCHLKSKFNPLTKQIEIEKLYKQVNEAKRKGKLSVENEALFKCELKRFGMRDRVDYSSDIKSSEAILR